MYTIARPKIRHSMLVRSVYRPKLALLHWDSDIVNKKFNLWAGLNRYMKS